MNHNHNSIEHIYEEALQMHESGFDVSEILAKFPHHRGDLEEMFALMEALHGIAPTLYPSERSLHNALERIRTADTAPWMRFMDIVGSQARFLLPVGALFLIIAVFVFRPHDTRAPQVPGIDTLQQTTESLFTEPSSRQDASSAQDSASAPPQPMQTFKAFGMPSSESSGATSLSQNQSDEDFVTDTRDQEALIFEDENAVDAMFSAEESGDLYE